MDAAPSKLKLISFYASILLLALALDFFLVGICKIVWFAIYAPTHIVAAQTLYMRFQRPSAGILFLLGAAVFHFLAVGHARQIEYAMRVDTVHPLTLAAAEWPQTLVIECEQLERTLQLAQTVRVETAQLTDYGCITQSRIQRVAGWDLQTDPGASWTWKSAAHDPPTGPGYEDHTLPWCRWQFYGK